MENIQEFLPKVNDTDDRLVKRNKMFTPGTGQNRCNAVERVSKEAEHAEMFKRIERCPSYDFLNSCTAHSHQISKLRKPGQRQL